MNGIPVVGICETPFTGTNELAKRVSDVVLAALILVLIAPLMLFIAIGVKLSSPGPVIFRQRRNGLDGHEIVVYKFRSMTTQDNGPEVKQATRNDPRVTRFGAFLRRNSLDELPQFFNVLQGSMSIVGPRPHAVTHNEQYRQIIKAYMVRHKVKPGITGWAQVNGHPRRDRHDREDAGAGRVRPRVPAQLVDRARPADHRQHRFAWCSSTGTRTDGAFAQSIQNRKRRPAMNQPRRRLATLISAGLVCLLSMPAAAQYSTPAGGGVDGELPWYIGIGQGFFHDTNVYNTPDGHGRTPTRAPPYSAASTSRSAGSGSTAGPACP